MAVELLNCRATHLRLVRIIDFIILRKIMEFVEELHLLYNMGDSTIRLSVHNVLIIYISYGLAVESSNRPCYRKIMKKIIVLCLVSGMSFGQTVKEQIADSKIEKVTVFLSGASVLRTAKVFVPSGKTELHFHKITPDLDVNSIQVKSEGDVAVQ